MPQVEPKAPEPTADPTEIRESVLALPEKLRLPLLLHYLEGFSLEEIARVLHVPVGTVKSRLHQGRKALRAELCEDGEAMQ